MQADKPHRVQLDGERITVGSRVRVAASKRDQFTPAALERVGCVSRIRSDGLIVVRWDGLLSEQVWSAQNLEFAPPTANGSDHG